jgi:hypothetical protein
LKLQSPFGYSGFARFGLELVALKFHNLFCSSGLKQNAKMEQTDMAVFGEPRWDHFGDQILMQCRIDFWASFVQDLGTFSEPKSEQFANRLLV